MSLVSGVTLQISSAEDEPDDTEIKILVTTINAWLEEQEFDWLSRVDTEYAGYKSPQVEVYGAGFNYFYEDKFATFVMSLPWKYPKNVVLLINPESGPTKIFRPLVAT